MRFRACGRPASWFAAFAVLCLLAGACSDGGGSTDGRRSEDAPRGESGLDDAGDPVRGGRLIYGIEAETSGGWCLTEAQLAPSGNLVRMALYDTLTAINADAEAKPYLA